MTSVVVLMANVCVQELPCAVWRRHTFSVSETRSRKGATAALLDMSKRWGEGRYLLFLNAHLDPMNPDSKLAQIRETRQVREPSPRSCTLRAEIVLC
jgi:hypothetical protein